MRNTIPKIIHYCWFGPNEIPQAFKMYMNSWKKFFPGYEIKEWNESNFDIHCCRYVEEAYFAKKYAFVSDYARFKILYEYGGLYFDTDVEVIRSFDDILERGPFIGLEQTLSPASRSGLAANPGLGLAAYPGMDLFKRMLDFYDEKSFLNADGTYNLQTIVDYTTDELMKYGLTKKKGIQLIDGIFVYPRDYFCPADYYTGEIKITKNTHSIHHYAATWHSPKEEYIVKAQRIYCRFFPKTLGAKIAQAIGILKFDGISQLVITLRNKKRKKE